MQSASKPPLFTVAIPTCNRRELLRQTLEMVLSQTCGDYEILIADNASTDGTAEMIATFTDPRLRYLRHAQNIGAIANFRFLAQEARGVFFVLNQDDDLLHRQYLERCRDAVTGVTGVTGRDEITMYGAAYWHGESHRGFTSTIPPHLSADMRFIANDTPITLDGREMAVHFLYMGQYHLMHPAIAVRTAVMRKLDSYPLEINVAVTDQVMAARVLCEGKLVYDPRPGAVFRMHGQNYSRKMDKTLKRRGPADMYAALIELLTAKGFDWKSSLRRCLQAMPDDQLVNALKTWIRYGSPAVLQELAWETMQERFGSGWPLYRLALYKVGFSNLLRFMRRSRR